MVLPSSGAISIANLASEYGGTVPHGILEYTRFAGLVPSTITGNFNYGWTSTTQHASSTTSPINIYYRRNIYQTIYTAAELTAANVPPGASFNRLIWHVYNAVPAANSILGMNIRLFHTTAADGSVVAGPVSGQSKTTVYADATTTEFTLAETLGDLIVNFGGGSAGGASSSFVWDGVNNICVESCTSQNQVNYLTNGIMRIVTFTNGGRASRTDAAGNSCGDTPNTVFAQKISTSMRWNLSVNQNVPIWSGFPPYPTISLSNYYGGRSTYP